MMAIAFLGYVLPYGQMSLWGATVITNLMSAIPWVGSDLVEFIWGGFSVNNATLNRFFSLHFVLPFVLAALALMHLIVLHDTAGSGNPLGVSGNYERIPFAPYYIFKDLITIFAFIFVLSLFVFFMPNVLGDSENYVVANPMQTPAAIVPEWYLLPFYAILRSIPNKLLGVIAMFSAILILLLLSITDISRTRGMQFRPLSKTTFFVFVSIFLILMQLGAKHVESPFIEFGQICTVLYFLYYTMEMCGVTFFENTLLEVKFALGTTTPTPTPSPKLISLPMDNFSEVVILQSVMLTEAVDIIETVINNLPAAEAVYDMAKNQVGDTLNAIDAWGTSAVASVDSAVNTAQTASTEGLSPDTVKACINSATTLADAGKAEIEETIQVAKEIYESSRDA